MRSLLLWCAAWFGVACGAELPLVASIFTSHMVLQREAPTLRVWGWEAPHSGVSVELVGSNGKSKSFSGNATAGGEWAVTLGSFPAGVGFSLTVRSAKRAVKLENVAFGDVWVCGGQSNMQFAVVQSYNGSLAINQSDHPNLRLFTVAMVMADTPQQDIVGNKKVPSWMPSNPKSVGGPAWDYFSGACYFFGVNVHLAVGKEIPIGLIASNWGGTYVQAWTSPKGLAMCHQSDAEPTVSEVEQIGERTPSPNRPSVLYNAMIYPILQLSIKGAIWWQAESNSYDSKGYACQFPAMIKTWREEFNNAPDAKEFAFLFVIMEAYEKDHYEILRDSQLAAMALPNVGFANAIDIGDLSSPYGSIHPRDKGTIGMRLSKAARAISYKESVNWRGPKLTGISSKETKVGTEVTVTFDTKGLRLGPTQQCVKCCRELPFTASDASGSVKRATGVEIIGEVVSVMFGGVSGVKFFGLEYEEYPQCALYDEDGLPGAPFNATV